MTKISTDMPVFRVRSAQPEEAGAFFAQTPEQDAQMGAIGCVRMDFGKHGTAFWHTWHPRGREELNSPEFKAELQQVVDTLRETVLKDLSSMRHFCYENGGKIPGGWSQNYGYVVETEKYEYCLRCNPVPGDYQAHLLCYDLNEQKINHAYPYSAKDAMKRGEIEKWRESFRENCACAGGIDILIRENFDGMHLKDGTVEKIVELYGYKRVEHVLANTVQERRGDGRFRPDNRAWAESHYIPEDEMHNYCFAARSHSAILDGFISNYRKLVMNLGMFDQKQCEPDSRDLDYTGKVLVLSPNTLKEEYWSPENQLWLAESGFGCSPTARGRSILCTCLGDGEQTRWNRNDFVGVLKDEFLPDWAKESLKQYQRPEQAEKQEMQMGGM